MIHDSRESRGLPRRRGAPARLLARSVASGVAALLVVASLLGALVATVHPSAAAFRATSGNSGNQLSADSLSSASGLSITGRCVTTSTTPTYVDGVFTSAGVGSFTVPATAQVNDALFVFAGSTASSMPGPPAGWTQLVQGVNGSADRAYQVWQRVATSADLGSHVYAASPSAAYLSFGVRGGQLGATPTGLIGYGSTMSAPSAPGYAGGLLVGVFGIENSIGATFSSPAPFTRQKQVYGNGVSLSIFTEDLTVDGPTGARTVTATTTNNTAALSFVVRRNVLPYADLSWSASSSTIATGYEIERPTGTVYATVSGRATTTWTDSAMTAGTTYSYTVRAMRGSWRSPPITASTTARADCYS